MNSTPLLMDQGQCLPTPDGELMRIEPHDLFAVAAVYSAGLLSPGPNFLAVMRSALAGGWRMGLATVAGVVTVNAIWASSALFGIGVVLQTMPWAFTVLKLLGAAYLTLVGISLLRAHDSATTQVSAPDSQSIAAAYQAGLATNLANVKAMVFYASAFTMVAPAPNKTITLWAALLIVLVLAFLWYGFVAIVLSGKWAGAFYARSWVTIDRLCGIIMLGFGASLVLGEMR